MNKSWIRRLLEWFGRVLLKRNYTNVGDFKKKLRAMSKGQIIKGIIDLSMKINGNRAGVDKEFIRELRTVGKRNLEKALVSLSVLHTLKLKGAK